MSGGAGPQRPVIANKDDNSCSTPLMELPELPGESGTLDRTGEQSEARGCCRCV